MSQSYEIRNTTSPDEKIERWSEMAVHGVYGEGLLSSNVDQILSHLLWLTNRSIFAEAEGVIFAIQDRVIPTRNYIKYVKPDPNAVSDRCRRCNCRTTC